MSDILKPKRQYKKKQIVKEEYTGDYIDEPIYNDPVGVDELVEEEEKQYPKLDEELKKTVRKRGALKEQLSDKLKESLAYGREKLKEKWEQDRIKNKELSDMYAIKRANKIIKQQMTLKQKMHCDDLDDEPE